MTIDIAFAAQTCMIVMVLSGAALTALDCYLERKIGRGPSAA